MSEQTTVDGKNIATIGTAITGTKVMIVTGTTPAGVRDGTIPDVTGPIHITTTIRVC